MCSARRCVPVAADSDSALVCNAVNMLPKCKRTAACLLRRRLHETGLQDKVPHPSSHGSALSKPHAQSSNLRARHQSVHNGTSRPAALLLHPQHLTSCSPAACAQQPKHTQPYPSCFSSSASTRQHVAAQLPASSSPGTTDLSAAGSAPTLQHLPWLLQAETLPAPV